MAQAVLVEKPVVFSGIWMPRHSIDDNFLRKVSNEFEGKPGAKAIWRLTKEGVTIVVTQSKSGRMWQTDVIAVQAIKEVTVNRYNPLCLMTLFVDQQRRFNALVCACQNQEDARQIVKAFYHLQRSLSGEGFQLDFKQPKGINWTLKTKPGDSVGGGGSVNNGHVDGILVNNNNNIHNSYNSNNQEEVVVVVEADEEQLDRESLRVDGRACYNVGVQAELGGWAGGDDDSDRISTASDLSYQSLKDELLVLSNEVRDIKLLLQQTTGISAEEYFRRQRDGNDPHAPWTLQPVPVKRTRSSDSEKRVNFANIPGEASAAAAGAGQDDTDGDENAEDFDIRSVGMQTPSGGGGGVGADGSRGGNRRYMKRLHNQNQGAATLPSRFQPSGWRTRSVSSSSTSPSPHVQSPVSPHGSVFTYQHQHQHHQHHHHPPLRETRSSSASYRPPAGSVFTSSGTVVRPIESVYQVQKAKAGSAPRSVRRKPHQVMVILPGDHQQQQQLQHRSASMPRQRTASMEAAPPGSRGGSVAERRGPGNSGKHARPQLPPSPVQRSAAMAFPNSQRGGAGGQPHNGAPPSPQTEVPAATAAAAVVVVAKNGAPSVSAGAQNGAHTSPSEAVPQVSAQVEAHNGGS